MNIIPEISNETISILSDLAHVDKTKSSLLIRVVGGDMPVAIAFFDIDKTLAHLNILYKEAIHHLFPNEDKDELIETFLKGFKLGNSFREFDRMHSIYVDGKVEWKDSEIYISERLNTAKDLIDSPGNEIHDRAKDYLVSYGKEAASVADSLYATDPEIFSKAQIGPLYSLLELYKMNGVLMFGFTANAKIFVEKLAMYLGLSDYFLDIATDEMMEGGGKEIAIKKLLDIVKEKGLRIPKEQLIFIGDSIRGDIGSGALFCKNNPGFGGYGIVVLENKDDLIKLRHLVNEDQNIHNIIFQMPTYGFVVEDVPLSSDNHFSLLSRDMSKFLFKL